MPFSDDRERDPDQQQDVNDDPGMSRHTSAAESGYIPDSSQDVDASGTETSGEQENMLPPPSAHRPDTMVRAVSPDARQEMEHGATGNFGNQPSFTKGDNAPPLDQSRYPYTVEQMDQILSEAPRSGFPDTPGGDGATPLSADRNGFLAMMGDRGRFPSERETERWARAVFNAIRQCAIEEDHALATEFASVVRVGEAPEVQVEEMMWGGDFLGRLSRALSVTCTWPRSKFYEQVAEEAGETPDDPWVDAAVHSFLGTLKSYLGDEADGVPNLGELQSVWETV